MANYREITTELKSLTLADVRERLQNLASTSLLVSFSVYKKSRLKQHLVGFNALPWLFVLISPIFCAYKKDLTDIKINFKVFIH